MDALSRREPVGPHHGPHPEHSNVLRRWWGGTALHSTAPPTTNPSLTQSYDWQVSCGLGPCVRAWGRFAIRRPRCGCECPSLGPGQPCGHLVTPACSSTRQIPFHQAESQDEPMGVKRSEPASGSWLGFCNWRSCTTPDRHPHLSGVLVDQERLNTQPVPAVNRANHLDRGMTGPSMAPMSEPSRGLTPELRQSTARPAWELHARLSSAPSPGCTIDPGPDPRKSRAGRPGRGRDICGSECAGWPGLIRRPGQPVEAPVHHVASPMDLLIDGRVLVTAARSGCRLARPGRGCGRCTTDGARCGRFRAVALVADSMRWPGPGPARADAGQPDRVQSLVLPPAARPSEPPKPSRSR